jgi:hypothetical protein
MIRKLHLEDLTMLRQLQGTETQANPDEPGVKVKDLSTKLLDVFVTTHGFGDSVLT